ncbi:MAG TPA: extracellular solute-binding protein [Roseiflexaceae bacterium]|nr:extracellular solute-binding protein [Roseiflexaceae bacterium]
MFKRTVSLLTLVLLLGTMLVACGGPAATSPTASTAPTSAPATDATAAPATDATAAAPTTEAPTAASEEPTVPPTNTPVAVDTFDAAAAGNRTVVKWYVGLGTGGNPNQIEVERRVVEEYNNSQDKIYLALQIVDNTVAYNTLATQIAAGNVPDIIGPVGTAGRNGFAGQFLDMSELITKNSVDLSVYDEALVKSLDYPEQGQIGLPFAVYPSFIYYNKDLFDEAGLPYPPQKFGEQYDGKEWNYETLRELAMKLTVDEAGNDATSPDFDPAKIAQFGYETQWGTDPRAWATQFGAASMVASDGKVQIPDNWKAAWKYFYNAMFTDHFMPSDAYRNSDLLGNGNTFNTGKVAMAYTHLWYSGSLDAPSAGGAVKNWDIAVVPSYEGTTTAKLHGDTFVIAKGSKNPDAAFEVYQFLLKNTDLLEVYGALPAIKTEQTAFFTGLDEKFAPNKVNWQVAVDSLSYPDVPNHEDDLPNFLKARDAITAFGTLLRSKGGLDVDAEITKFQDQMQQIFDEQQ